MIGASSLSGDTLIACHFPVVQLPAWQLPVQALCGSAKRPGRLCPVGLTRAVSLPERDSLAREQHAFAVCRRHFSSSYGSLNEERTEEEGASDSSGRYDSNSSPEESGSHAKDGGAGARGNPRSHNSFLPNTDLDEDEEDEDIDGDNLHRYHEDSSFVLHGNSNWPLSNGDANYAMSPRDPDSEWGNEGTMLGTGRGHRWLSNQPEPQPPDCPCFHDSRSAMACSEEDSDPTCRVHSVRRLSPDRLSNGHTEYVSDSSCNSSDGVLVNFCTIYNRSNNPATPRDLSSPALRPSPSPEGSVFLNLQPVSQSLAADVHGAGKPPASGWSPQGLDSNCNLYSLEPLAPGLSSLEVSDLTACLQSQAALAVGTNQKYYKLVTCDLSSQSPSPAWSSLTGCPEGPGRGSPFLLSLDHRTERQHSDVKKEKEDQQKETRLSSAQSASGSDCSLLQMHDYQVATTSTAKALCRRKHPDGVQSLSHSPCSLCPGQSGPHSSKCQDARAASTQPSASQDREHDRADAAETGVSSAENMVRYSKAQRPTSLPIQPFVLVPSGKAPSQAQHLGCLLEQYINKKNVKSGSSQPGLKFKGKSSQCLSNLQSSPMENHFPVVLEAPTSSDTCSTCTPTPDCFTYKRMWGHPNRNQRCPSPCTSKSSPKPAAAQDKSSPCSDKTQTNTFLKPTSAMSQPGLVKIPTYQDLINLTPKQGYTSPRPRASSRPKTSHHPVLSHTPPTLPLTTDTLHPNRQVSQTPPTAPPPPPPQQQRCPQYRAAPAADSGFFHSSFTAALSSVAPLSSLSSLFSLAASGLHPQQIQDSVGLGLKPGQSRHSESLILSDRPPTEFCLSPDTSYESMSISHLQRRGLLRSVSRAVDLIMAHFGSSRDPEEKMRLGNSSCSPTIAGLVLEHLCPAVQNILEDGLRDHKLDVIIGQRRNHCWGVVEISTRIGPSTRVLQSLVSKIRQCPQLTSHCMRLRAFIMGLLNLRALEFWLSHLQSQKDVVKTYYHSWGFLSMSLGRCQPLFQELLLLLQPLSALPFDLNLLLEPRLLRHRQLCSEDRGVSPPQPCSALLATSWPRLHVDKKVDRVYSSQQTKVSPLRESFTPQSLSFYKQQQQHGGLQANRSPALAPIPEWWPKEREPVDGVVEGEDCSRNNAETWFHISMESRQEDRREERDFRMPNSPAVAQEGSPCQGGLRWAKLFGAADWSIRAETTSQSHIEAQNRRKCRPSQWLHLDRSQLGLLAQSIRSLKLGGPHASSQC
ncbi:iporin [Salarias fasciatus]|uniref:iporin n=1 Tax=Salarias fasciatus TaxID=181472 RepID=UPI0011769417|nr:iporin-like [Salarias fasciatus]